MSLNYSMLLIQKCRLFLNSLVYDMLAPVSWAHNSPAFTIDLPCFLFHFMRRMKNELVFASVIFVSSR